ncbi:hypothetical protein HOU25_gp25 [Corynebacterium phage Juicebox]|uniref:Uncharacterized protein n=1 Tax=Corynebacterium phage Juicebox TaxID=2301600 RepID=A0A385UHU5_9CAUD|nr:hypothetical protein HOU25_gp25 [Corynebacterium phage Juicebox]AYB69454.1 hypothetical protein JUICEBOX_25 [Corynebacterium phage Juicebox]
MSGVELWFGPGGIAAGVGGVVLAAAAWVRAWRESRNADEKLELQRQADEEKLELEREKIRLEERNADLAGLQTLTTELRTDLSRIREDLTETRKDLDEERRKGDETRRDLDAERRRTDEATEKIDRQGKELTRLADERAEAWELVRRLAGHIRAREEWTVLHLQPRPPALEPIPDDVVHIVFPDGGPYPREPPDTT